MLTLLYFVKREQYRAAMVLLTCVPILSEAADNCSFAPVNKRQHHLHDHHHHHHPHTVPHQHRAATHSNDSGKEERTRWNKVLLKLPN